MHHYNSTQYRKTETVFSIFPFLQTNITSQILRCGHVEVTGVPCLGLTIATLTHLDTDPCKCIHPQNYAYFDEKSSVSGTAGTFLLNICLYSCSVLFQPVLTHLQHCHYFLQNNNNFRCRPRMPSLAKSRVKRAKMK